MVLLKFSDSFSKLSTEEIQINIIHKGVGAIKTDVMLAASDAIIIDLMFVLLEMHDN
jgi:hypothetical protein